MIVNRVKYSLMTSLDMIKDKTIQEEGIMIEIKTILQENKRSRRRRKREKENQKET